MNWHALFVKTGAESIVEQYICYNFSKSECHSVVPMKKINERKKGKLYSTIKTLFPGYIFINTDMDIDMYHIIKNIPNVYRVLNHSNESFYKIYDEEMEPILRLIEGNSIIDYSKAFIENSKVYIESGPLKGLEGLIKKIDKRKCRAKVALDFMGSEKVVELGIELLQKNLE